MSSKVFKYGCLFFALFMIIGHSLVPHRHHYTLTNQAEFHTHYNSSSLLDLLASTFKQDLGNGHLENFKPQPLDKLSLSTLFILTTFTFCLAIRYLIVKQVRFVPAAVRLPHCYLRSNLPSRAPPVC